MKHAALLDRMAGSGSQWWATHYAAVADREAGEDAIVLTVGQIDLPAPTELLGCASARILAGRHKYSHASGESHIRERIARKYSERSGREIAREQVVFSIGAQGTLALLVQSLLDPGDHILIPEPRYITYGGIARAASVDVVPVPLDPETGFHLDAETLARSITPRSRALVLNSPHNPTGATLSKEEITTIGDVAAAHDLWILSDEVYEDFVYDGQFASPFDDPAFADRTIAVGSLSKSFAVPGWRCGWAVGPESVMALANRLFEIIIFSSPPFLQDAADFALSRDFPECGRIREALARRAVEVPRRLSQAPGIEARRPEGGIFVFLDVRRTGMSGGRFARDLYAAEKVSVMPGEAFGDAGAGHVRLCIGGSERDMEEACVRILRFAHSVKD